MFQTLSCLISQNSTDGQLATLDIPVPDRNRSGSGSGSKGYGNKRDFRGVHILPLGMSNMQYLGRVTSDG